MTPALGKRRSSDALAQGCVGRPSSGRTAELAGMPRVEFLLELGHYRVFPFEAELRDLESCQPTAISTTRLQVIEPQAVLSEWLTLDLGPGDLVAMALALENPDRVVLLDGALVRG